MSKPNLIYITDAMCSWCYGFSPEVTKVREHFGNRLTFQLQNGGLRPGNLDTMAKMGDTMKRHWNHVEQASGRKFNYDIIQDHSFVYDTEPASRAVVTMRELSAKHEYTFFNMIQEAFYLGNKNTNELATYIELVKKLELDTDKFTELFESEEMKLTTIKDFEATKRLGVQGFPALLMVDGENYYMIAKGYASAKDVIGAIDRTFAKINS